MGYKFFLILNMLVALVLGLAFLVIPVAVLEFFGTETYVSTEVMGRLFGSVLTTVGLLLWFAKDVEEPKTKKGFLIALFIGSLMSLIVFMIGTFSGKTVIRSNGLIIVGVYLVFTLGYAFLAFLQPRMK